MKNKRIPKHATWRAVLVTGLALIVSFAAGPATGAEGVDPDADNILRSMSSYLAGLPRFGMNADIDNEIITHDGQKLQLSSFSTIVMERPEKFHIERKGMLADAEFIFDGETLTLHGRNLNVYAQMEVPGTIDDAIRAARQALEITDRTRSKKIETRLRLYEQKRPYRDE